MYCYSKTSTYFKGNNFQVAKLEILLKYGSLLPM
jgi:hypothetical protein